MGQKKLLVADDSLTIQKVIRLALSNEGYEIQAVSDGKDAMEQISLFRPDVILVDVSLPGKSAFELKDEFNRDFSDLSSAFVLMSSAFEQMDEPRVAELGFEGRLVKPFDPAHLRQVLIEVLNSGDSPTGRAELDADYDEEPSAEDETTEPALAMAVPEEPASVGDEWAIEAPAAEEPVSDFMDENGGIAETPPERDSSYIRPPAPPAVASEPVAFGGSAVEEEESTLIVQPPDELSKDLWGDSGDESGNGARDGASDSESGPEQDIKELTESTIRMSGLDDYQWSVNESAKLKSAPAAVPDEAEEDDFDPDHYPSYADRPELVGDRTLADLQYTEPTLPPLPNMLDTGASNFPVTGSRSRDASEPSPAAESEFTSDFSLPSETDETGVTAYDDDEFPQVAIEGPRSDESGNSDAPDSAYYYNAPTDTGANTGAGAYSGSPQSRPGGDVVPLTTGEMEELIHQRVQEAIREMAQRMIPEIAEKIIREEIDKLLSDPPA